MFQLLLCVNVLSLIFTMDSGKGRGKGGGAGSGWIDKLQRKENCIPLVCFVKNLSFNVSI